MVSFISSDGVICAAPMLNGWYRAQIMAVYEESDECDIKYVDYGGYSRISSLCLKQIRYRKVLKFSNARKLFCNLPKIHTKRPNLRVFRQKDANGIANSEEPDQIA